VLKRVLMLGMLLLLAALIATPVYAGIGSGKVIVSNYICGAKVEAQVTISNEDAVGHSYLVSYRYPDNVDDGYSKPPMDADKWVTIGDSNPYIEAGGFVTIPIILKVPDGADVPAKWSFWVSVIEQGQSGMVQIEYAQKWLIETAGRGMTSMVGLYVMIVLIVLGASVLIWQLYKQDISRVYIRIKNRTRRAKMK